MESLIIGAFVSIGLITLLVFVLTMPLYKFFITKKQIKPTLLNITVVMLIAAFAIYFLIHFIFYLNSRAYL